jgi:hypothetical protein
MLALLLLATGCADYELYLKSGKVGRALRHALRETEKDMVTIAQLTDFPWNELFVFEPYTPRSSVCLRLAIAAVDCLRLVPHESKDDSESLMVFRDGGRIVHIEMHFRANGVLPVADDSPYTRTSAIFDADRQRDPGGTIFHTLVPRSGKHR